LKKKLSKKPKYGWNETPNTRSVNIRMPKELIASIAAYCKEYNLTRTMVIVRALMKDGF
jgi:NRPS condensation-like uncharacterized protein